MNISDSKQAAFKNWCFKKKTMKQKKFKAYQNLLKDPQLAAFKN